MKTAATIERMEAKKQAEKRDGSKGDCRAHNSSPVSRTKQPEDGTERLKPFRFQPGRSGNPGGRPKVDLAAQIARAIFEQDGPAIFEAFRKMLRKGSPYAFDTLANRAYGKLKETHQVELPYKDVSETDILKRIAEIEQKLGYSKPQILPPADDSSDSKPN